MQEPGRCGKGETVLILLRLNDTGLNILFVSEGYASMAERVKCSYRSFIFALPGKFIRLIYTYI